MLINNVIQPESPVREFLDQSPLKLFVGGEWVAASGNGSFAVLDPGTGEKLVLTCVNTFLY